MLLLSYTVHVCKKSVVHVHVFCCMYLRVCVDASQTYLPEPLYDRMVGTVAVLVNSVLSPVVDVDVTQTAHEQLQGQKARDNRKTAFTTTFHLKTEFCQVKMLNVTLHGRVMYTDTITGGDSLRCY